MCARLRVLRCSQLGVRQAPTVLPRATTSPRERVQTGANTACFLTVKSLRGNENSEASASGREGGCRLDKLGVTGSSPVPPMTDHAARRRLTICFVSVRLQ